MWLRELLWTSVRGSVPCQAAARIEQRRTIAHQEEKQGRAMEEKHTMVVRRVVDAGQWFEPGTRVGLFPAERDPRKTVLELAALGSYEVVACDRIEADEHPWLEVRLRRLAHA
jgi:hypothetical protein